MNEKMCAVTEENGEQTVGVTLTTDAWRLLLRLVFLGNYVVNGWRAPKEELAEYNAVAETMYRRHYAAALPSCAEDVEENELADIRDRLGSETEAYLAAFEEDVFSERSALCRTEGAEGSAPPARG